MSKSIDKIQTRKNTRETTLGKLKKELREHHACYVLITCTEPTDEGKMEVEMNYEGDESLAAFLLENASQVFDQKMNPTSESK